MAASRPTKTTSTKGSDLILYRLGEVENAVKEVSDKLDAREHISKADLVEFREAILLRFNEKNDMLQKQIDALDVEKSSKTELADFKKVVWSVFSLVGAVVSAYVIYSITTGAN